MTFQRKMRQMVDDLLVLLDGQDDPDLEPTAGGSCDDEYEPEETEPSLGSFDRIVNQEHA
ncbi:hypothetical protein [Bradyrhizobium sp. 1(2017)]|uniref:hypothetical protein n=1 Tax=Bradyrhizobium sp. 1(2017) TaxID=1404888 RepID=UPI00140F221C|nr:hypothetical protein [Bradyrhizobium sp. 1(2017)]QIO34000.1 hypothetical protein HAP40_20480 [Bradyrhizobium sp. 1(2017)]